MTDRKTFSVETAADQLKLLLDFYDIDYTDAEGAEVDGQDACAQLVAQHRKLIRAIMRGQLEIVQAADGAVEVVQHLDRSPSVPSPLTYHEITGATGMVASQNGVAIDDAHKQILCTVAGMTHCELRQVLQLKGTDILIARALGLLFFAA